MAIYFYGEDTFAARQAIFKQASGAELNWFSAVELKQEAVEKLKAVQGGLFGRQLTILRDPSALPKSARDALAESFNNLGKEVVLWDRIKPDKRSIFWRAVKKEAQEFKFPAQVEIVQGLKERAEQQECQLTFSAAELLINRLGLDRWRLHKELDRLCLLTKEVTDEVVAEEVSGQVPIEIFTVLEALMDGQKKTAIMAIQQLLRAGASEFYILSMLSYQYRVILLISSSLAAGHPEEEISGLTKLHPFVVKKNLTFARRLKVAQVLAILTRLAATDFALKQGKINPRDGLMMLLTTL